MTEREELERLRKLKRLRELEAKAQPVEKSYQADLLESPDPTEGMSGGQKFLSGVGKSFVDVARGIGQLGGGKPGSMLSELGEDDQIEAARERDASLLSTGAGLGGNIAGSAAMFAPTVFVPGANTYTGAALMGATMGAIQPVAKGESRGLNTALGGLASMAGKAAGDALGRAVRPVSSRLGRAEQALAHAAAKEGIPLSVGQQTGSRPIQVMESVMENLPMTSGPQLAGKEAQQRAFTAAALRRAGVDATEATAEGLSAQKGALGKVLGEIAEKNALDFNAGILDDIAGLVDDAGLRLPPDSAAKISGVADKILSQVDETGKMAGTNYQGWREPLRELASSGGAEGRYFSRLRAILDNAFKNQVQGADADLFREASRKYANVKTIIDAMGGPGKLPARGQVSPAQLGQALSRAMGREGRALGRGDLNELVRIGQTFVSEQIPNSGTAQRQLAQALLTSGGGSLIGGAGAGIAGGDPVQGAMIGGGITAGSLMAPKLVQSMMNSPAGRAYLTRGAVPLTPAMREALSQALRVGATASVPALSQ